MELKEDDKVELPVLYERLPDFYFCCGTIWYQFKECESYIGQQKKKTALWSVHEALSKVKKTRLNRGKDRWNRRFEQPNNKPKEAEHHGRRQAKQIGLDHINMNLSQTNLIREIMIVKQGRLGST